MKAFSKEEKADREAMTTIFPGESRDLQSLAARILPKITI
jgi:hypothetical protein